MVEEQPYQRSIYEDIILIFTLKKYGHQILSPKNCARKKEAHTEAESRLKRKSKVAKIVTAIHHFEKVIHQHPPPSVIIQ